MNNRNIRVANASNIIKNIAVIICIYFAIVSVSFAQANKPVLQGSKVDHTKGGSKSSGSSHSSSSAAAVKKKMHKASNKNPNSSNIFPTFADQMKGSKQYMSFNMKTKSSFSTMMTNYKSNSIFPSANTSKSGKINFGSITNKSTGVSTGINDNAPSGNSSKNSYKPRTRGPFFKNSSSYSKIQLFTLGKLRSKYAREKKVEQTYNPNLHYYNLPKTSQ